MIVMKFGGSSVSNAERIREVIKIVQSRLPRQPVVVASAFRGVTDDLFALGEEALRGHDSKLEKLRTRHAEACEQLGVDKEIVKDCLDELAVLLKGISLVKELTPRTLDYVVSFGERLSTRIIAAAFTKAGIPAEQHDAFDIGMLTDDNFGGAAPLPEADAEIKRHITRMKKLPVITGYVGRTKNGDITTLGRNGSDFTATILGGAMEAEEVQIWSDTDGIMTADPRIAPGAKPLEFLTFEEASELAYYGGKVLHPSTLVPAIRKGVPIRALNTFKPDHPGTTILAHVKDNPKGVKSIAHHMNTNVLTVTTARMLLGHGFLARIFTILAKHRVVVNMISTSEVSVSMTIDSLKSLEEATAELKEFCDVTLEKGRAIVCVVGEGLKQMPGIAGDVFSALKEAGVNVLMISQGASKINVAFVVDNADCQKAVQALHQRFFKS
jgi:aspartate kinase